MAIRKVISRSIEDNTVAATDFQGAVTSLSNAGNLTFSSTGQRILGDFSNSTVTNRVAFQTSTANSTTNLAVLPNGTGTNSFTTYFNNSDPTNASTAVVGIVGSTDVRITAGITGTGTYLPIAMLAGGSERLRITTAGNIGVGTTAPFSANGTNLEIANATVSRLVLNQTGTRRMSFGVGSNAFNIYDETADAERFKIDASGNVGIGNSPSAKLTVTDSVHSCQMFIGYSDNNNYYQSNASQIWTTYNGGSERMRLDTTGALLLNTASNASWRGKISVASNSSSELYPLALNNTDAGSGNQVVIDFYRNGTRTGYVANTNTATNYYSVSDYRLKDNVQPMQNALSKVATLKPVTYTWKIDGSNGQGFIAHELAESFPEAVSGEKDALDKNGDPFHQGIDTSLLVATLTAAIQELKAENDTLKQRLDAAGL
jgi:hypothetical protein